MGNVCNLCSHDAATPQHRWPGHDVLHITPTVFIRLLLVDTGPQLWRRRPIVGAGGVTLWQEVVVIPGKARGGLGH